MERRGFILASCLTALGALPTAGTDATLRHAHRKQKVESKTGYREVFRLAHGKLEMIEWDAQQPGDWIFCLDIAVGAACDSITDVHAHICRSAPDMSRRDMPTACDMLAVEQIVARLKQPDITELA